MKKFFAVFMLVSVMTSTVVSAFDITPRTNIQVTSRSILTPGNYFWKDQPELGDKIVVRVNLTTQMVYVMREGKLIGATNISSGREGYDTPVGVFKILGKEDNHWSKAYKADMPYTMWFTDTGVALHSGSTPGQPVSHGCVHLPDDFAARLYQVAKMGMTVEVREEHPDDRRFLKL